MFYPPSWLALSRSLSLSRQIIWQTPIHRAVAVVPGRFVGRAVASQWNLWICGWSYKLSTGGTSLYSTKGAPKVSSPTSYLLDLFVFFWKSIFRVWWSLISLKHILRILEQKLWYQWASGYQLWVPLMSCHSIFKDLPKPKNAAHIVKKSWHTLVDSSL